MHPQIGASSRMGPRLPKLCDGTGGGGPSIYPPPEIIEKLEPAIPLSGARRFGRRSDLEPQARLKRGPLNTIHVRGLKSHGA